MCSQGPQLWQCNQQEDASTKCGPWPSELSLIDVHVNLWTEVCHGDNFRPLKWQAPCPRSTGLHSHLSKGIITAKPTPAKLAGSCQEFGVVICLFGHEECQPWKME